MLDFSLVICWTLHYFSILLELILIWLGCRECKDIFSIFQLYVRFSLVFWWTTLMKRFLWVACRWKTLPEGWNAYALFFHPVRITSDQVRVPKSIDILGLTFPVAWKFFLYYFFNEYLSSFLECFLLFFNETDDPIQSFGGFSSAR